MHFPLVICGENYLLVLTVKPNLGKVESAVCLLSVFADFTGGFSPKILPSEALKYYENPSNKTYC